MLSAIGTAVATGAAAFGATVFGMAGLICPPGVAEVMGGFGCGSVLELDNQIPRPIAASAQTVTILIGVKNPELFGSVSVAISYNSN